MRLLPKVCLAASTCLLLLMPEATCQGRPLPGASSLVRAPMRDGKLEDGEVAKVGRGSLRSVAP